MNPIDRLPPSSLPAERSVLGGILRYPDALLTLQLRDVDFYTDPHQRIFRAMQELAAAQKPVDLVMIHEHLQQAGQLENVGGVEYLTDVWQCEPIGSNVEYHAAIVREVATLRALIRVATEILRDAYDRTASAEDMLATAEGRILGIAESFAPVMDRVRSAAVLLAEGLTRIDSRIEAGGRMSGLSTGYTDFDDLTGGFKPAELSIVAARPSIGKTAFALNVAERIASERAPVMIFSLEQPEADIADRLLAMGSGVPLHRFTRASRLNPQEAELLNLAAGPEGFGGRPIYFDDTSNASAARIGAVTRRMVRRHGVKVVVVDYLGLIAPEDSRRPRWEQVGLIAQRMKHLARECNVSLLLLAQLNREVEGRGDSKPRLSDLRDSGEIEQHADKVIFLHRPANLPNDQDVWPIDVTVAKARNGPIGDVRLNYRRPILRFENASHGF